MAMNIKQIAALAETSVATVSRVINGEDSVSPETRKKVLEVIDHYDRYGMTGGMLLAEGKIIGFSMGEILGDTIYIHIEKSIRDKKGAYQMLTNQYLKHYCTQDITYVNREEDMGDEGLRRSKNAYHPLKVLKKYTVEIRV